MPDYQLVLLHAEWCGHCNRFNPKEGKEVKGGNILTWSDVKKKVEHKMKCMQFEEKELENDIDGWDMESLRNAGQGWPTLLFVVKNNEAEKYKPHSYFEGNRDKIDDFFIAIDKVLKSKNSSILSGGEMSMVNKYRTKYKKYKELYANLLKEYKKIKNKRIKE
jgi:thiol-disulfide isomerase/thioredoxin